MADERTEPELGRSLERVDTVFLPVPDFDAAIEWYTDVLGLSLRWRDDDGGYAAIDVGETPITLVRDEAATPLSYQPFNFYTADIEGAHERFVAAGVDADPVEEATDVRFFEFRDPFGNALGVCSF